MTAMSLAALDGTVVSTAVPQIVGDLGGFSAFTWIFAGYLLAVTVTLPVYGKLSDTFGRRPVLITGVALFLLGSLLCATAWNMPSLIAFRIVQGLGAGGIQGTVQTIAADLYPLKERPRIQSRLSTVWAVSALAGPAIGGLLATWADWRWVFLINLPAGAVALRLIARHLHEPVRGTGGPAPAASGTAAAAEPAGAKGPTATADAAADADATIAAVPKEGTRPPVDWPGALAVFAAGTALLTALVQGGIAWPWLSVPSLSLLGAAVLLIALTVFIERRAADPILPGWVWRRRPIAAVNLSFAALGLLIVAPSVFIPIHAQSVLGLGPVAAGFVLSVMVVSWPVSAALSSHLYNRVGFRQTALLGMALAALVLAAFPLLPHPGSAWQPALLMLLLGAALGLFQLPLIVGVQSTVGWSERGTATASILFCRQIGQSLGAALFGAVANGVLASRLGGAGDLDSVSASLENPHALGAEAAGTLRRAVDAAVDQVHTVAAVAAAVALLALLLAPRRFPVVDEPAPEESLPPAAP
ncbi:MFS transporter [Streptomyces sp. CAU 1734]|uniref:MFS transporter n=1 Tax=Streptomyces sp. CAU 1734 TaxID=3140360 RepID=UPI00326140DA